MGCYKSPAQVLPKSHFSTYVLSKSQSRFHFFIRDSQFQWPKSHFPSEKEAKSEFHFVPYLQSLP